jgi:hypothetical protein
MDLPALELKLSFEEEFALAYTFPKELSELDREDLIRKLLEIAANIFAVKNLFPGVLKSKRTGEACELVPISLSQRFFLEKCAREAKTATIDQLMEFAIELKRQEMIYAKCLKNLREK